MSLPPRIPLHPEASLRGLRVCDDIIYRMMQVVVTAFRFVSANMVDPS